MAKDRNRTYLRDGFLRIDLRTERKSCFLVKTVRLKTARAGRFAPSFETAALSAALCRLTSKQPILILLFTGLQDNQELSSNNRFPNTPISTSRWCLLRSVGLNSAAVWVIHLTCFITSILKCKVDGWTLVCTLNHRRSSRCNASFAVVPDGISNSNSGSMECFARCMLKYHSIRPGATAVFKISESRLLGPGIVLETSSWCKDTRSPKQYNEHPDLPLRYRGECSKI